MMDWVYILQRVSDGRVVGAYFTRREAEAARKGRMFPDGYKITPWAVTKYDA